MLNKQMIEKIIDLALPAGDFVEVFCENNAQSIIHAYSDRLESSAFGVEGGVGIRIFNGLNSVYVYSNDISEENLFKLTKDAIKGLKGGETQKNPLEALKDYKDAQNIGIMPNTVPYGKKLAIVNEVLREGKEYSPEISQMLVRYIDFKQNVVIANSDGVYAEDDRVKTRLFVQAFAQNETGTQAGYIGPGAMKGFEFYDGLDLKYYAREAARCAIAMLHADKCKGGRMPVVVNKGFGGLLFHEACGHSLEASSVAKGMSEFSGKLGQQIASPLVTLIDDGSIKNAWGSLSVDDEGTPTQKNVLIEKGILKSYMVDKLNAKRMDCAPTGSGRRQNYRFTPTSRMTNTYIENGESNPDDIIAATEKGIYIKYINGGSVNSATGDFNFAASESYMIENGKITKPVSGATLIGNGGDILKQVDMVGNDLAIGQGNCYAGSGALYIGAGQPTIRIAEMTVGGVK